jgi:hypothetical protein
MAPEGLLPCSQETATGSYRESANNPTRATPFYFSKIHFNNILPPTLRLPNGLLLCRFSTTPPHAFLFSLVRATFTAQLILLDYLYFAMSTTYNTSHCEIFSSFILFHPFWVQIFSSAPSSQTFLVSLIVRDHVTIVECKAFWRWCLTLRNTGFVDFVHRPEFQRLRLPQKQSTCLLPLTWRQKQSQFSKRCVF